MSVRVLCHECFDYFLADRASKGEPVECPVCGNTGPLKADSVSPDELIYYLDPRDASEEPHPRR